MIPHVLSLMVLAFAVSVDGFGVGVTYGLRKIRIPILSVVIIACCSGLIIWLSMQAGAFLSAWVSASAARWIGAFILILIGCWALFQLARSKRENGDHGADDDKEVGSSNREANLTRETAADTLSVLKLELKSFGLVIQILRTPQAADIDRSGIISPGEAFMLGVALSLDAFGAGLGAALLGLPSLLTAIVIAVSSALFLISGTKIGLRFAATRAMNALSVLPGILLIMIGIMKLL